MFTKETYATLNNLFIDNFGVDYDRIPISVLKRELRYGRAGLINDIYQKELYKNGCHSNYNIKYNIWNYDRLNKLLKHLKGGDQVRAYFLDKYGFSKMSDNIWIRVCEEAMYDVVIQPNGYLLREQLSDRVDIRWHEFETFEDLNTFLRDEAWIVREDEDEDE